LERGGTSDG